MDRDFFEKLAKTINIPMTKLLLKGEFCQECGIFVPGFEYKICCTGSNIQCGCMELLVEPCLCNKCWNKLMS